jgi:hypothetical protein
MSAVDVIAHESLPQDSTFHLDAGIEDPEEYMVVHELLGRGQLLNAYEAKMTHQVRTPVQFHPVPARFRPRCPRASVARRLAYPLPIAIWRTLFRFFSRFSPQHGVEFGHGILNRGKAQKREKRPPTQIEILAAIEREKQEKKAARKAAKVRKPPDVSRTRPFPRSSRPALKRLLFFSRCAIHW